MKRDLRKDILQWDVKSWSKVIDYWEINIDWNKIDKGLELGGHAGGLSLWLALKGKHIVCSDVKDTKKSAEELHNKYDVSGKINYQDIDASNIPYENHFDVIVFKSILGGIGRNNNIQIQQTVISEIHKALKPGGKLLFAENLIASPLHRRLRKIFISWGSSWRYVSISEMDSFLKIFSTHKILSTGVLGSLGRTEGQRNILASLDSFLLNSICPDSWKYIGYGIAEK